MSLIFDSGLTGASVFADTNFDSEYGASPTYASNKATWTNAGDWSLVDGGLLITGDADTTTHISTACKAFHAKFTFNMSSISIGVGKTFEIFKALYSTYAAINMVVKANGVADANQLLVYRLASDGSGVDNGTNTQYTAINIPLVAATDHTFEIMYRCNTNIHTADGVLRIWLDDTLILDSTDNLFGVRSSVIHSMRAGIMNSNATAAAAGTFDLKLFQLASGRDFSTHTRSTFYVDNLAADNLGDGSVSAPFRSISVASQLAQGGDAIKFVNNGLAYPYRLARYAAVELQTGDGRLSLVARGSAGNLIEITSDTGYAPLLGTINATQSAAGYEWAASATPGVYYLQRAYASSRNPSFPSEPSFFAHCSAAVWASDPIEGMTIIAQADKVATVAGLTPGTYYYGTNSAETAFSTIFYYPAADEVISTAHFEVPFGNITSSIADQTIKIKNRNYFDIHHLQFYLALTHGLDLLGTGYGVGAYAHHLKGKYLNQHLIADSTLTTVYSCESSYSTHATNGGGFLFALACGGNKMGLYSHHHLDDCFEVSLSSGTNTLNLIGCVAAHSNQGGGTDGFGFELEIKDSGAGATLNILNCAAYDCYKGLRNFNQVAGTTNVKNFGAINCSAYGIDELSTALGYSATYSNNGFYGNGANTHDNGTADYASTGDVTADPLLTFDATTGTYALAAGSPWIAAGVDHGISGIGINGEPLQVSGLDIGAIQTTFNPLHPRNL